MSSYRLLNCGPDARRARAGLLVDDRVIDLEGALTARNASFNANTLDIMEAWDEAEVAGRGSLAMDGRMVDVPVMKRAQNLLSFADAIEARGR